MDEAILRGSKSERRGMVMKMEEGRRGERSWGVVWEKKNVVRRGLRAKSVGSMR